MLFKKKKPEGRNPRITSPTRDNSNFYYRSNRGRDNTHLARKNRPESVQDDSRSGVGALLRSNTFSIIIFGVILLLVFINSTMGSVKVTTVQSQSAYRSNDKYQQSANELFNNKLLNKSKLTFRASDYEAQLLDQFPELASVSAVVPLAGRNLQVSLGPHDALARVQVQGNQNIVLTDSGAIIVSDAATDLSQLPALTLQQPPEIIDGNQLLTSNEVNLISLLKSEFDGSSTTRPKLLSVLYDIKKREMQARFEGVQYYAKFTSDTLSGAGERQVGALVAALQQQQSTGTMPSQYIDVRVAGRVFIK